MVAAAPEAQPQVDLVDLARTVLSSVVHGLREAVTASPVFGVLLAAVLIAGLVRSARRAMYSGWERDPVRLFTRADKATILARAGSRCEHHVLLFGRCTTTDGLQADHVHPWSRGGHTVLTNGQALCKRHNREKHASVPFARQLRKIEVRRAAYFPPGVDATVSRRRVTTGVSPAAAHVPTSGGAPAGRGRVRRG